MDEHMTSAANTHSLLLVNQIKLLQKAVNRLPNELEVSLQHLFFSCNVSDVDSK
jgi:hypothetical protein